MRKTFFGSGVMDVTQYGIYVNGENIIPKIAETIGEEPKTFSGTIKVVICNSNNDFKEQK